ncbi:MAG: hypothetical protein NZM31_01275 [Gemmatales bacterium]|nr:hypothetical protein [Gemmatales bacterium]MDW8385627.1 hypothetical protein [Gemmatales bacterium]
MRILFIIRHTGYLRHYESVVELLARHGHEVHIRFNLMPNKAHLGKEQVSRLCRHYPNVTADEVPYRRDLWKPLLTHLRGMRDYLRYLHPRYARAPKLVRRAREHHGWLKALFFELIPGIRTERVQNWIQSLLRRVEMLVPSSRRIDALIRECRPDIVLVTPLVDFGSQQLDYLKSAQTLGIHNVLCVASWDNLTNKGIIQLEPEAVIVWNHDQKREAVELHGIPPEKVIVTGAQSFDKWFERRPSTTREQFCRLHGFDPARPTILYVCSSAFIAEEEARFALKWLTHLRSSPDPVVAGANVLIRPHPLNAGQWADVDVSEHPRVAIYPRGGAYVSTEQASAEYFDSIYHSDAVVGINTSALIEAGIIGRTSHTILAEEFADTQEGTLHFDYLIRDGYLKVARDLSEHVQQLRATLDGGEAGKEHVRRFVGAFIRPHGLDQPCTPIVAHAIEELARRPQPEPLATTPAVWFARVVLLPIAIVILCGDLTYRAVRRVCWWAMRIFRKDKRHEELAKKAARLPAGSPLHGLIGKGTKSRQAVGSGQG